METFKSDLEPRKVALDSARQVYHEQQNNKCILQDNLNNSKRRKIEIENFLKKAITDTTTKESIREKKECEKKTVMDELKVRLSCTT